MEEQNRNGNRIKELRERLDLSQDELANQIQISKTMVSLYESGKRPMSQSFIKRVAETYNVDRDWILGNIDQTNLDKELNELLKKSILTSSEKKLIIRFIQLKPELRKNFVETLLGLFEEL